MGERPLVVLKVVFEEHQVTVPIYEHRCGLWDVVFTSEPLSQGLSKPRFETGDEVFIQLFDLGKMSGVIKIFPNPGETRFWERFKLRDPDKGYAWVNFWICEPPPVRYWGGFLFSPRSKSKKRRWAGTLNNIHPRPRLELEVLKGPWD